MIRKYHLTEADKASGLVTSMFDGDCVTYTVYESKEEMEAEKMRLARLDDECKREKQAYADYLNSLEEA